MTGTDLNEAFDNALGSAEVTGIGLFIRQAADFAPQIDREQDTIILVVRGPNEVALLREAVTALDRLGRYAINP